MTRRLSTRLSGQVEILKADDEGMTITPTIPVDITEKIKKVMDDLENWKGHHKNLITEIQSTQGEKRKAGDAIFALYKNLLDKTALLKWNKIVLKQIGVTPWTDLKGKVHKDKALMETV